MDDGKPAVRVERGTLAPDGRTCSVVHGVARASGRSCDSEADSEVLIIAGGQTVFAAPLCAEHAGVVESSPPGMTLDQRLNALPAVLLPECGSHG